VVIVDTKFLNKFVITNFVLKLPLVQGNKICPLQIPLEIPPLTKPVSHALVGYHFSKVGIQLLYIAIQWSGQVKCPKRQKKHLIVSV
jgi:hypothetical protein